MADIRPLVKLVEALGCRDASLRKARGGNGSV
jgi:hypothetical protein